jgi:hypothetical protein
VFEGVTSNQSACATETRFTVHSQCSFLSLSDLQKLADYFCCRKSVIREEKFLMVYAIFYEIISLISFKAKPNYSADTESFEYGNVVSGSKSLFLHKDKYTPYLSVVLSDGALKATNLLGMIQFKYPF